MAKVFLIVGNVGAGKSTWAKKIEKEEEAYVFTIDEWMNNLFWMDAPKESSYEWALEKVERVEKQMLLETLKILDKNINVVLDIGFFSRKQRQRVIKFLTKYRRKFELIFLDVDKETRWQRVDQRNRLQTETYEFNVSKETFEFCESIFEPLDEGEKDIAIMHN